MNMVENWQQVVFERYAKFDGRASRAEYWWFALANTIVGVAWTLLGNVSPAFTVAYMVWMLGLLIPSLAVGVRRLHDTNRSGWYLLLTFIPLVGGIVLLVFLATQGAPDSNRYGPPPVAYAAIAAT